MSLGTYPTKETLILSFVLSDYTINLMRIKLKMCISNSGLSDKTKE